MMKGGESPPWSYPVQTTRAREKAHGLCCSGPGLNAFCIRKKDQRQALINKGVSILKAKKKSNKQRGVRHHEKRKWATFLTQWNKGVFEENRRKRKLTCVRKVARQVHLSAAANRLSSATTDKHPPPADACPCHQKGGSGLSTLES